MAVGGFPEETVISPDTDHLSEIGAGIILEIIDLRVDNCSAHLRKVQIHLQRLGSGFSESRGQGSQDQEQCQQ